MDRPIPQDWYLGRVPGSPGSDIYWVIVTLLLLLLLQDEPARLVEQLRSDDPAERKRAFLRLKDLGASARTALDKAKGDPDAEKQLGQGIRYAEANDYVWDVINGRYLLAEMHRRLGQHDVARTEFQQIRELALSSGHSLVAQECDAALRALATEGIQRGHMSLHARNIAATVGATGDEIDRVADLLHVDLGDDVKRRHGT